MTAYTAAGLVVEVLPGSTALATLTPQREALATLARAALEPNPFLCPWFFFPALAGFTPGDNLRVVLVRQPPTRRAPGAIVGLFPLLLKRGVRGLPFRCWTLWQHDYNYLGTPLVHAEFAPACLDALLAWLRDTRGAGVLELPYQAADGPLARALVEALRRWDRQAIVEPSTRALLEPAGRDAETYLRLALNSKRRTELKRQEKKLGELGTLTYRTLAAGDAIAPWLAHFLTLEGAGWKGRAGTAFAAQASHAAFLGEMLTQAHAAGAVQMLGLFLGDAPVALKCNLRAGAGAVAFKIAYDEAQARYSPGVLLELENLRQVCAPGGPRWMDSCAIPDHPMINRLWLERRTVQTLLIPTGRMPGDFVLGVLPLLRWVKRWFKRRPNPVALKRGDDDAT